MTIEAFDVVGRVEAVLVTASGGDVISETSGYGSLATRSVPKIQVVRESGIRGDRHAGARLADVRERAFLSFGLMKGTEIANFRQWSAVSTEELAVIATAMDLPSKIPYGSLGENLVLSGIPKLTELPTGTMFFFKSATGKVRAAVLVVWEENKPCTGPGEVIQKHFPEIPSLASKFPKAAIGRRGVVGCVYASGNIHAGDDVVAKIPRQQIYSPE